MTQPTPYERSYSFTDFSSGSPSSQPPGAKLDAEFDGLARTTGQVIANLAKIQRDDGKLASGSVNVDQLGPTALALIAQSSFAVRGAWVTGHAYVTGDLVTDGTAIYLCMVAHTSGVLATDVAAGKFVKAFDVTAAVVETPAPDASETGLSVLRQEFTALAGQTTFGLSSAPVDGYVSVYKNGSRLPLSGFLVSGSSIVLASGATAGDKVLIEGFQPTNLSDAALVTFLQSGTGAVTRTMRDKGREIVSVEDFGVNRLGNNDYTTELQRAIDQTYAVGGKLRFFAPYHHSGLVWKNGVSYEGVGFNSSPAKGAVLIYTGTGHAGVIANPVNSSTFAAINFQGLSFRCDALSSGKGLLYDTGSTYLNFERCRLQYAGDDAFGLVLDQSEVVEVHRSIFEATGNIGSGALIWLANMPTPMNPTAIQGYTNRITISDGNQINAALGGAAAIGIRDDGGSVHSYERNNFNGGAYALKLGNPLTVSFEDNQVEGFTQAGVWCSTVGGGIAGFTHVGNYYVSAVPSLKLEAGSVLDLFNVANTHQTPTGVACESGLAAGVSGKNFSVNNRQVSLGSKPFNNYLQPDVDTVGTVTLAGASVAGVHTYSSQAITWRLMGDVCSFNLYITLTAKGGTMAGGVRVLGLPLPAKASSNLPTACTIGYISNIGMDTGYTQFSAAIGVGNSHIDLLETGPNKTAGLIDSSYIVANTTLHISGSYPI